MLTLTKDNIALVIRAAISNDLFSETPGDWAVVVQEAAEAIAQAHEQDKLIGVLEERAGNLTELGQLRGQLAMMAKALGRLIEIYESPRRETTAEERLQAHVDATVALQSAPTVLASLRLMEGHGGGVGAGHRRYASDENEWPWVAIDLPFYDPLDLGGAVVIVLAGPDALQEQSKAELPDKECSVNEGPETKSEQR